jgi:DNA-binding NarL/FixJ family response regulator
MMRTQLREALEKTAGWAVVGEAATGRRALETWDEHEPTLTVMDFVMPEMDGLAAGRSLSRQHPHAPVLIVTIDPSRQLEQEAKKAGIKGVCQKADVQSILKAVKALLKGGTYFQREPAAA